MSEKALQKTVFASCAPDPLSITEGVSEMFPKCSLGRVSPSTEATRQPTLQAFS
jgi:hypothetical protein